MIHYYGIRHHGPGSASSLLQALQQQKPELLLVEGPSDGEAMLSYVGKEGLVPPVALLFYNVRDMAQAAYFPFAVFSPEWQAFLYAGEDGIPVRLIDLPVNRLFGWRRDVAGRPALDLPAQEQGDARLERDPLACMAELAGYDDHERWWESMVEQWENDAEIFSGIAELMAELRGAFPGNAEEETLLREAHMRKSIREAVKEGFGNIAVICGAWHVPALQQWDSLPAKKDNALLRGLPRVKVKATWIPWAYEQMVRGGYGAGVLSPAWYEFLFRDRRGASINWMTQACRLFRKEQLEVSSAHAVEAVRLAEALAAMRGQPVPGLGELGEAALSVLCEGNPVRMALIEKKLMIGDAVGRVPASIPSLPLQQDIEQQVRSARLTRDWQQTGHVLKDLDLRKSTHRAASLLLHRLRLINIPWGTERPVPAQRQGSFHENWRLQWRPSYALRVIEANLWGNTLEEAAGRLTKDRARDAAELNALTELVDQTLKADLPAALSEVLRRLQQRASKTQDVMTLMKALPALAHAWRYGNVRQIDTAALEAVLNQMMPRVLIGLPAACAQIDTESSRELFDLLLKTNQVLHLLASGTFDELWAQCLLQIAQRTDGHGLLQGAACRLLFDLEVWALEDAARRMSQALSPGHSPAYSAQWLEGFLFQSGLLLVHHRELYLLLDRWVAELPAERFRRILPLLRRTFSGFSASEREKLLQQARKPEPEIRSDGSSPSLQEDRADLMLPVLQKILSQ